jgi:arginine deiminase
MRGTRMKGTDHDLYVGSEVGQLKQAILHRPDLD